MNERREGEEKSASRRLVTENRAVISPSLQEVGEPPGQDRAGGLQRAHRGAAGADRRLRREGERLRRHRRPGAPSQSGFTGGFTKKNEKK